MSGSMKIAIAGVAAAAMLAAGSVVPVPEAKADPGFYNEAQVQLVRHGGRHDNWRWRRGGRGDNDNWVGPAIGGFAAGAIVGSALTRPRVYVAPRARYAYTNWDAYCAQRFRSYDPISNTYVGYDGFRHPCP